MSGLLSWGEAMATVSSYSDKPGTTVGLLAAGILPVWVDLNSIQILYFALLIPPAAYHCYKVFLKGLPTAKNIFKWFKDRI